MFSDEEVTCLADSFADNCVLRFLQLATNSIPEECPYSITSSGWRAFSVILQNPNSALETVDLSSNLSSIDDDALAFFATALVQNNKVKEFFLNGTFPTNAGWVHLSNVLFDKSSIMGTYESNHSLQRVFEYECDESWLPSDLKDLLQINRENTQTEAARRKILNVHFSDDFSMQPFIDMDLNALPHAIAWMARDAHGISLLYNFLRNTSLFVDVGGARKTGNEPESKRQRL